MRSLLRGRLRFATSSIWHPNRDSGITSSPLLVPRAEHDGPQLLGGLDRPQVLLLAAPPLLVRVVADGSFASLNRPAMVVGGHAPPPGSSSRNSGSTMVYPWPGTSIRCPWIPSELVTSNAPIVPSRPSTQLPSSCIRTRSPIL